MSHNLPPLRNDHPVWHAWASVQGRLYATAAGLSALLRGASVTVDAATPDGLSQAIAAAERVAAARQTYGKGKAMDAEASRRLLNSLAPPSLAQIYRDFGGRWEIEPVPPGAKWLAVQRESGGDYVRIIAARDVHALRLRLDAAEHEEPEEREPAERP